MSKLKAPNFNKVFIAGNLTRDPELKYTPQEMPIIEFTLAVNDGYGENERVSYIDVKAFKKTATLCDKALKKGSPCLVDGRFSQDRWETNKGENRSKILVIANSVNFLEKQEKKDTPDEDVPF
jgi:single-strand DNA-binding protein